MRLLAGRWAVGSGTTATRRPHKGYRPAASHNNKGAKAGALVKALLDGKLNTVATIQTFPFAMQAIRETEGTGLAESGDAICVAYSHSAGEERLV